MDWTGNHKCCQARSRLFFVDNMMWSAEKTKKKMSTSTSDDLTAPALSPQAAELLHAHWSKVFSSQPVHETKLTDWLRVAVKAGAKKVDNTAATIIAFSESIWRDIDPL